MMRTGRYHDQTQPYRVNRVVPICCETWGTDSTAAESTLAGNSINTRPVGEINPETPVLVQRTKYRRCSIARSREMRKCCRKGISASKAIP